MVLYNQDIIDIIGDVRQEVRNTVAAENFGPARTQTASELAIANLVLTPSTRQIETTGEMIGVVTISFSEPAALLVNRIREYSIGWRPAGEQLTTQFSPPSPPYTYLGLPIGVQLTFTITPITVSGARGTPVSGTVTIPQDNVGPNQPSTPVVTGVLYGVEVAWDGLDTSSPAPQPMPADFDRLDIYSGATNAFDPDTQGTLVGVIQNPNGGTAFVALDTTDQVWIRTVAIDRYGNESPPSTADDAVPVESTVSIEPGSIGYEQIAFKNADNLIPDGSFEDVNYRASLASPTTPATFVQDVDNASHGAWRMDLAGNGTVRTVPLLRGYGVGPGGNCMQVSPHDKFLGRTAYRATVGTNGTASLALKCYDALGAALTEPAPLVMTPPGTLTWSEVSQFFEVPVGTVFAEPQLIVEVSSNTGTWNFDAVEFRKVIQTAVIDDAAIGTAQIEELSVEKLTGGVGTFDMVVGGAFRSIAKDANNIEKGPVMDPRGIHQYDLSGNQVLDLPAEVSDENPNSFSGTARLKRAITESISIEGVINEIAEGSAVVIANKVTDPTSQPSKTIDYHTVPYPALTSFEERYGFTKGHDNRWYHVRYRTSGSEAHEVRAHNDDGTFFASWPLSSSYEPHGIVYLSHHTGRYYILVQSVSTGDWYVEARDTTFATVLSRILVSSGDYGPTIGIDHTNAHVLVAWHAGDASVFVRSYAYAADGTRTTANTWHTGPTTSTGYSYPYELGYVARGTFDFGAERYVFRRTGAASNSTFQVFTTAASPTRQTNNEWPSNGAVRGAWWDGTRFWSFDGVGAKTRYEGDGNTWTSESGKWWASYTWYDNDVAGTGTHETKPSPRLSFTMTKRARLTLTGGVPQDRGQADDPNAVRFYLFRGTNDDTTGLVNTRRQGTYSNLVLPNAPSSLVITSAIWAGAGLAPPTTNNFPAGIPGQVAAATGGFWVDGASNGSVGTGSFLESIRDNIVKSDATVNAVSPFAGSVRFVRIGRVIFVFGNISRATGFSSIFTKVLTIPVGVRPVEWGTLPANTFYNSADSYRFRTDVATNELQLQQTAANTQNMTINAVWMV